MKKRGNKFLYWFPRILSIVFLLFLITLSFDVFGQGYGFWGTVLAFIMHNIITFCLLIILLISWKYEIVGGIGFILAGIAYVIFIMMNPLEWNLVFYSLIISGPAFIIGIFFLVNWFKKRKLSKIKNKRK
jgi:hypothetical protein